MGNSSELYLLGFAFILIGMVLILYASYKSIHEKGDASKESIEAGVIGFIGPIPFGFATSKKMLIFSLILFLILFLITALIFYKGMKV